MLAADDAGDTLRTLSIGDDGHGRVELVGSAIEGQEFLAFARETRVNGTPDLVGVEHMQRTVVGDRHIIGDVDQGRNGPQANGAEATLQPAGRGTIGQAAKIAADEQRARREIVTRKAKLDFERRSSASRNRCRVQRLQCPQALGGQIASDAADAQGVGAVGRDLHIDHRVIETERLSRRRADRNIAGKIDDAFMIVGDHEFAFGDQHAARFDAADIAFLETDAGAGNIGAGVREDAGHSGAGIGCAADDLNFAAVGLDKANSADGRRWGACRPF